MGTVNDFLGILDQVERVLQQSRAKEKLRANPYTPLLSFEQLSARRDKDSEEYFELVKRFSESEDWTNEGHVEQVQTLLQEEKIPLHDEYWSFKKWDINVQDLKTCIQFMTNDRGRHLTIRPEDGANDCQNYYLEKCYVPDPELDPLLADKGLEMCGRVYVENGDLFDKASRAVFKLGDQERDTWCMHTGYWRGDGVINLEGKLNLKKQIPVTTHFRQVDRVVRGWRDIGLTNAFLQGLGMDETTQSHVVQSLASLSTEMFFDIMAAYTKSRLREFRDEQPAWYKKNGFIADYDRITTIEHANTGTEILASLASKDPDFLRLLEYYRNLEIPVITPSDKTRNDEVNTIIDQVFSIVRKFDKLHPEVIPVLYTILNKEETTLSQTIRQLTRDQKMNLMRHEDTPEIILRKLTNRRMASRLLYLSMNPNRLPNILYRRILDYEDFNTDMARNLVDNPQTPDDILALIREKGSVFDGVFANSRNAPEGILLDIARSSRRDDVLDNIFENHHDKPAIMNALANNPRFLRNNERKISLATRATLDRDTAINLATDPNDFVRQALALNPSIERETFQRLYNDQDPYVRFALATNPMLVKEENLQLVERVGADPDLRIRLQLASRDDLPEEVFSFIAEDEDVLIREEIINSNSTPNFVIREIARVENNSELIFKIVDNEKTPPLALAELAKREDISKEIRLKARKRYLER